MTHDNLPNYDADLPLDGGDLIRTVRLLEIRSRQLVRTQIAGLYASAFRGSGLDFVGHRPYEPGDDVRHIDWNVTARARRPHVKCFQEERERVVLVALDVSPSMRFGSAWRTKLELARETAAVLALAAILGDDRCGLLLLGEGGGQLVRPGRGRNHGLKLVRRLLLPTPGQRFPQSRWPEALGRLPHGSVIFLISDFLPAPPRRDLAAVAHRHDLAPVWVYDPLERNVPLSGAAAVRDPESGRGGWLRAGSERARRRVNRALEEHTRAVRALFRSLELDHAEVATDRNFIDPLRDLMRRRLARQER